SGQRYPDVAVNQNGDFMVVWASNLQDGSDRGIFGQRFGSGGAALGVEFMINEYTLNAQTRPSIAADKSGFLVSWESNQGVGLLEVLARRYTSAGAAAGPIFQLNTYTPDDQASSAIAASGNKFVVVWQSDGQDGPDTGAFGQ